MKRVVVLGSTGSIGTQTLDILTRLPEQFVLVGLGAGRWTPAFEDQIEGWEPELAAVGGEDWAPSHSGGTPILCGPHALARLVEETNADVVVVGTPGLVGMEACLTALEAGKVAAIANKEPLVTAGELVTRTARAHGGTIVPVDSEHSGVWQCLRGEQPADVREIVITSSGGAFRDAPLSSLADASVEQALKHPTWSMGPKITVDSATLMNKGLEIIEASWLFDVPCSQVSVVLHRQSIVHALVEFWDGSVKAQLAVPDMRLPIVNALTYPDRVAVDLPRLNLAELGSLTFEPVDDERYPSLQLARQAAACGGTYPAVLNAANEVAVERFLNREIRFTEIVPLVAATLDRYHEMGGSSLEALLAVDAWARRTSRKLDA